MTRLIDADKLHDLFDKNCVGDCNVCNFYTSVHYVIHNKDCKGHSYCGLIDNAPTVEKIPQGKWKDITPNHYFTCGGEPLVICPFCGDQESKHVQGIENHMWNFCPNCGADMREADNESI